MNLGPYFPKFSRIMPWIFSYLVWILPLCMGGISIVETEDRISFGWNVSNPRFIKDKGAQLSMSLRSNLAIVCPYGVNEYYKIYWVTKEIFENCFIPANVSLEVFLVCDKPNEHRDYEFSIREFTGVYGQKDFNIGENYYLATMSGGTERTINNTWIGACKEKNMKLNLSIIAKPPATTKAPTDGTNSHTTKRPPVRTTQRPTTTTTLRTTTRPPTTTKKATTKLKTTSRPPSTDIPDINSGDIIIDGSNNGNSAVIDANSGQSLTFSCLLLLSICLSVIHLVKLVR